MLRKLKQRCAAVLAGVCIVVSMLTMAAASETAQELPESETGTTPASEQSSVVINGYGDVQVVKSNSYVIADGVTEVDVVLNNTDGDAQVMGYLTLIDLSQGAELKASYKGYYNGTDSSQWGIDAWGMEETTVQAAAYENSTGENVVVATNGDYFNMQTGQPLGPLVINGVNCSPDRAKSEPYFAVLKDGTVALRDAGVSLDDVQEAIGGPFFLIRNGVNVANAADTALMPRNSIGLTKDGKVVLFLADGRQEPVSVGMTLYDQAEFLLAQGVVECLYLDGGGSATYATERGGNGEILVRNSPCDGVERTVSSALLVVANYTDTGNSDPCSGGHTYDGYDGTTGEVVCSVCAARASASGELFSGLARDLATDRLMYFISGKIATGHQYVLSQHYYFDENGLGYEGEYTLCGEVCVFDDGQFVSGKTAALINAGMAGKNVEFVLYTDGTLVLEGTGKMEAFSYYSAVPWYLDRAQIKHVKVGAGITNLGDTSFYEHLYLETVEFAEGSKVNRIDGAVFYHCIALKNITLPEGVKEIYGNAFAKCFGLEYIYLPDGVSYISSSAFTKTTSALLSVAPDSYAKSYAEKYSLPYAERKTVSGTCGADVRWELRTDGFLSIYGTGAMTDYAQAADVPWYSYRNVIHTVTFEPGVTSVGAHAFENCTALSAVELPAESQLLSVGSSAFRGCTSLETLTLPETVTSIDAYAFEGADALSWLYLPDRIDHIGDTALTPGVLVVSVAPNSYAKQYAEAHGIAYVERPVEVWESGVCGENLTWELTNSGVLTITGAGAMSDFVASKDVPWYAYRDLITEVNIGADVTALGDMAFYKCKSLVAVNFAENSKLETVGGSAFNYCTSLSDVELPAGVTTIYGNAFANTAALQSVYLPDGVSFISAQAFRNSENVVLSVGEDSYAKAFAEANGVQYVERKPAVVASGICGEALTWELDEENTLTINGTGAMTNFAASKNVPWYAYRDVITEVNIGANVTALGDMAFYKCKSLAAVNFAEDSKLEIVGGSAFNYCTSLTSVELPERVTTIYGNAFANDANLEYVYLPDTVSFISGAAYKNTANVVLNVGEGGYAESFALANGIAYTKRQAGVLESGVCGEALTWELTTSGVLFVNGSGEMANFASSKDVPWYAYRGMITEVNIDAGVESLGDMAFYKCTALQAVNFAAGSQLAVVGGSAFNGCASLEEVVLPAGVTTIYGNAFANCPALTAVTIPKTVAFVSTAAFKNSPNVAIFAA